MHLALLFAMLPGRDFNVVLVPCVDGVVVTVAAMVCIQVGVGAVDFQSMFVLDTWQWQSQSWQCQLLEH